MDKKNEAKQKVLSAFLEKPSNYHIKVVDNSMLPKELQKEKELSFTVKPPVLGILSLAAEQTKDIPNEVLSPEKQIRFEDAAPFIPNMVKAICILSHGKKSDYPDWWEKFFIENLTPKEVFQIFHESLAKTQTDFFLTSFQIASQNPMMMNKVQKASDSTRSNS